MDDTAKHALFVLLVLSLSRRICSASEFITYNNKTLARFTRQTCRNWDKSKFHCFSSNDCVNLDLKCDGKEDCPDGSDESDITCKNFPCYGYLFRCDYGACISSDERCNGERNCRDNSDEKNCGIISRTAGNCRSDQFECEDSTCIDIYLKCDGIGNCPDNSDETEENCLNFFCPGYAYKCKYGGCVDGDSRCNGVKNCIDNSDEENCVDTIPTSTSTILFPWAECVTPPHPGDGSWHYQTSGRKGNPNTPVDAGTVIVFKCSENYKLNTTNEEKLLISCEDNGKWSHKFPSCERLCPAIYNVPHTTVSCRSKADSVIPCDKATDLTFMTFKCDPFYEPAQGIPSRIFCYKGTWSNTPKCVEAPVFNPWIPGSRPTSNENKETNNLVIKRKQLRQELKKILRLVKIMNSEQILEVNSYIDAIKSFMSRTNNENPKKSEKSRIYYPDQILPSENVYSHQVGYKKVKKFQNSAPNFIWWQRY